MRTQWSAGDGDWKGVKEIYWKIICLYPSIIEVKVELFLICIGSQLSNIIFELIEAESVKLRCIHTILSMMGCATVNQSTDILYSSIPVA